MRLTPAKTMLAAVVALVGTVALGAFLTGTCLSRADPDHAARVATQSGTIVYCGPRTGLVIRACPFLLAGSGLLFILGALWLGWQERVEPLAPDDKRRATGSAGRQGPAQDLPQDP